MPKFSLIVPVYNTEKYIDKCLKSIVMQSFTDYEIIVVNDGTKDNSMDIAKKYPVKIINQKNKGLSAARNKGVENANGDYLLFIDSDDYIEKDLLKNINKSLKNDPDLVRFQIREVFDDKKMIDYNEKAFKNMKGPLAFIEICQYHYVELACPYAIKKEYYLKENYKFKENTYHEDFGLIPLVIMKAECVNSISYVGYNYYQRTNSIMSNKDYDKTLKKVTDFYNHYNYLIESIDKTTLENKTFKSFISNSLILKITELKKEDYKKYLAILKQDKVFDNLLTDTLTRKIKKCLVKISPKLYYKVVK